MPIQAISHVAIGVRDMDASLVFYRDVLGMRVCTDEVEQLPAVGNAPAFERRAVHLRWREGPTESFVVLDQRLSQPAPGEPAELFQVGTHHWGLWVDDLDSIVERARAARIPVAIGPLESGTESFGEPPGGVIRTAFLHDPDGNFVQIDERR